MSYRYLLAFVALFLSCCVREADRHCITGTGASDTLFYIGADPAKKSDRECQYPLYSTYFGEKHTPCGALKLTSDVVWVKFTSPRKKGYEKLFSFRDKPGAVHQISIWHRNWGEGKGMEFTMGRYDVLLDTIIHRDAGQVAVLNIKNLVHIDPQIGALSAVLFFSSYAGFVGSYYLSRREPWEIIEARGDILRDEIDYSGYSFVKMM